MDLETLRSIAELMEERGLTRIKIDDKDMRIDISRAGDEPARPPMPPAFFPMPAAGMPPVPAMAAPAPSAPAASIATPAPAEAPAAASAPCLSCADGTPCDSSRVTEVTAPMVGVFYAAPAPGAEPFVHVGSKVKKGETLCILEAMKLMNEVVAERDGEVVEACVGDGELVEYGRVLFRIY